MGSNVTNTKNDVKTGDVDKNISDNNSSDLSIAFSNNLPKLKRNKHSVEESNVKSADTAKCADTIPIQANKDNTVKKNKRIKLAQRIKLKQKKLLLSKKKEMAFSSKGIIGVDEFV